MRPPPDLGQHPAFQPEPKSSTSDAPLMVTTSTEAEIRNWAQEKRNSEAEEGANASANNTNYQGSRITFAPEARSPSKMDAPSSKSPFSRSEGVNSPRTGESFLTQTFSSRRDGRKSSETAEPPRSLRSKFSRLQLDTAIPEGDVFTGRSEDSPMSSLHTLPKTPIDSVKSVTTSVSDGFEKKKRNLSNLFKSKTGSEKSQVDLTSSPVPEHSYDPRAELVRLHTTLENP